MATIIKTHDKVEKATILLVQGSFQTPLVYESLVKRLRNLGYPTIHPSLPSCTDIEDSSFPSVTLIDDALAVRLELIRQIEYKGKTVVVVMHSYGGLVGSEAIPQELSYDYRKSHKLSGGVIHLYYFSAFILPPGKSVLSAFGESPNNDVKPDGRFGILNGASILYNDLPEPEAKLWESRLILQSYNVQKTELTRGAYEYIPSSYLVCENDQAAPTKYQEMFAGSAGAQIERCSAGHSAMLSQTEMLAGKISTTIERAVAEETPEDRMISSAKTRYLMTNSIELDEQVRLDLQHQIWLLTLQGQLHLVSLPNELNSILDVGCGTGVWAVAMASVYPHVLITATDLTPPKNVISLANVKFIEADADQTWPSDKFDFIHGRMITSGIHDWPRFLFQCWEHLEFGGVLELLDICHPFHSENRSIENSSAVIRFGHAAEKCWRKNGLDYRASMKHVQRLTQLGFEDVAETEQKWPLGEWADTERERKMGKLNLANFRKFLDMAGVNILISNSEMPPQIAQRIVDEALQELSGEILNNRLYLSV